MSSTQIATSSPWVQARPTLLTGLEPSVARLFASSAVTGNYEADTSTAASDKIYDGSVRRASGGRAMYFGADVDTANVRAGNAIAEMGKGDALRQPYAPSSILQAPVAPAIILGIGALPDTVRVITAAATFEDAYFMQPSLINNQPMLLDAVSYKSASDGNTSVVNYWAEVGTAIGGVGALDDYLQNPELYFTYGRLVSISGTDLSRNQLAKTMSSKGDPYGPPAAFIPTTALTSSILISKLSTENRVNLPTMVEEFISKMLIQHPHLCGVSFTEAVFEIAVGIPDVGTEIVTVLLKVNNVQLNSAERAAFNKIYGSLGNKVNTPAPAGKAASSNQLGAIVKAPFIMGLEKAQNMTANSINAKPTTASASFSEEELANTALAKMYSDGMYVATIIYKKGFDIEESNSALSAQYSHWIRAAAVSACGTFSPFSQRKLSMSEIRASFAEGEDASIVEGLSDYANGVDNFVASRVMGVLRNYNPQSGDFNYFTDSLATGADNQWGAAGYNVPEYTFVSSFVGGRSSRRTPSAKATSSRRTPSAKATSSRPKATSSRARTSAASSSNFDVNAVSAAAQPTTMAGEYGVETAAAIKQEEESPFNLPAASGPRISPPASRLTLKQEDVPSFALPSPSGGTRVSPSTPLSFLPAPSGGPRISPIASRVPSPSLSARATAGSEALPSTVTSAPKRSVTFDLPVVSDIRRIPALTELDQARAKYDRLMKQIRDDEALIENIDGGLTPSNNRAYEEAIRRQATLKTQAGIAKDIVRKLERDIKTEQGEMAYEPPSIPIDQDVADLALGP